MKKIFLLAVIISLTQIACKKSAVTVLHRPLDVALNGQWRMIAVKDNATSTVTTKPVTIPGDVDITFTSATAASGTFMGNTPTNAIWQSGYTTGAGQTISIPSMAMTKAGETSWGYLFVNNIRSSLGYSFENADLLHITTVNKILTFQKL